MLVGIPAAGIGELSEPAAVTVVAACPGGHETAAREPQEASPDRTVALHCCVGHLIRAGVLYAA